MSSNHSQDSLPRTLIGILLLVSMPLLITAFFIVLGNIIEDGVTNRLTMIVLTRRVYIVTMRIVGVLSIAAWVLAARKSYFYLLGIPVQVVSIFAAIMLWLVFCPKIILTAVIKQENTDYYLAITSPNGNYELSVFECEKQQCIIDRLIHTDSDPIVDATIRRGEGCYNFYIARAITSSGSIIEHAVDVPSVIQRCNDK